MRMDEPLDLTTVNPIEPESIEWVDRNGELHQGIRIIKESTDADRVGEYWWKLMLSDLISILDEISGKQTQALKTVLAQFNPRTGIIVMSQAELAKEAGVSLMTMNKVVKLMCNRGLIARQCRGVYCINPLFLSQGGKGRFDTLMIQYRIAEENQNKNRIPVLETEPIEPKPNVTEEIFNKVDDDNA